MRNVVKLICGCMCAIVVGTLAATANAEFGPVPLDPILLVACSDATCNLACITNGAACIAPCGTCNCESGNGVTQCVD